MHSGSFTALAMHKSKLFKNAKHEKEESLLALSDSSLYPTPPPPPPPRSATALDKPFRIDTEISK